MGLCSDFEDLANKPDLVWDVVVVGSGYGAGVAAARLAESGAKKVLVLERGKEYSRFPDTLDGLTREVHWSGKTERNRLGLYDLHADVDLDVLVGCGLGGTSLINANVSIEADPAVFALDLWPKAIRDAAAGGDLAEYVARARAMLRPMQRPGALLPKVAAMARAAPAVRGAHFERLDVNIHFGPPGKNPVGIDQPTCTDCGDCVTGCNVGAKNTLCFTYLPLAKHFGAEIQVQCDVDRVARRADGLWEVRYQHVTSGDDPRNADRTVVARAVVLGAGVLGTTGILLRSGRAGLPLSPLVGSRFSGNGDALAFAYACQERLNTVGVGAHPSATGPRGATILGVIDARNGRPLHEGVIIEDGAFPSGMLKLLYPLTAAIAVYAGKPTGLAADLRELTEDERELLGDHDDGALNHTLLSLLMGHDGADGRLELDEAGNARVVWPALKTRKLFTREGSDVRAMAAELSGIFVPDPLYTPLFRDNLITVHPLGGAAMGEDSDHGAVDDRGRVFDGRGGVHSGLYVADGSVIPTSLGANPLLTITSLSERIAEHISIDLGLVPRASSAIS